jgi:hypothetical protein
MVEVLVSAKHDREARLGGYCPKDSGANDSSGMGEMHVEDWLITYLIAETHNG